ncbi:hypothetical protein AB0A99_01275 [Streptomyces fradiae]|uniref:hypothetical protein n=1 Tax=Streptomyces fradiae TaxID=1906 RepID=UPI0033F18B42
MRTLLREVVQWSGRTIVTVAHDPVAATHADRVAPPVDGRIVSALNRSTSRQAVPAFAAPPDPARAAALREESDGRAHSLAALVGQTRAAALRVPRATRTTGRLSDQTGRSPPRAGEAWSTPCTGRGG